MSIIIGGIVFLGWLFVGLPLMFHFMVRRPYRKAHEQSIGDLFKTHKSTVGEMADWLEWERQCLDLQN